MQIFLPSSCSSSYLDRSINIIKSTPGWQVWLLTPPTKSSMAPSMIAFMLLCSTAKKCLRPCQEQRERKGVLNEQKSESRDSLAGCVDDSAKLSASRIFSILDKMNAPLTDRVAEPAGVCTEHGRALLLTFWKLARFAPIFLFKCPFTFDFLCGIQSVVNGRSSSTTRGVLASSDKTLMGRRLKEHLKTSLPLAARCRSASRRPLIPAGVPARYRGPCPPDGTARPEPHDVWHLNATPLPQRSQSVCSASHPSARHEPRSHA